MPRMRQLLTTWYGRATMLSLRERCEAVLRDLLIPAPFDEQIFCDVLADQRGRPIALLPLLLRTEAGNGVLYGLVISNATSDTIVYERDTSRAHQQQIIVHEACHLILGHRPTPLAPPELPSLPDNVWAGEQICHVLGRSDNAAEEEHEAEILASLILEQAAISAPHGSCDCDTETTAMLVRLTSFYRMRKGA
jgi:hypothetical protein